MDMDIIDWKQGKNKGKGYIVGNRRWPKTGANRPFSGRKAGPVRVLGPDLAVDPPCGVAASREAGPFASERLGQPLNIREVAALIGCSPWTVRQTLIPEGLPVFRSGASGKLIFYTNQVVRWIERQQQGGFPK